MSPTCRASGFSLLEVLLAGALGLLLLSVLAQVLVPSFQLVATSSQRTGMQQQARTALDRIERDLRHTTLEGVTLQPSPAAVAINPFKPGTFSGTLLYDAVLEVYYRDASSRRLCRREILDGLGFEAAHPFRPTPTQLRQLAQNGGDEAILAADVEQFQVSVDPSGTCTVALNLTTPARAERRQEQLQLARTVYLRNH